MPSGWREHKLKDLFSKRSEPGEIGLPTASVTLDRGLVLRHSLDRKLETNLEAYQHLLVRKNDIAYNMMRMWQGALGLANFDCIVSPAYVVCEPKSDKVHPKFFYHLFKSPILIKKFKDSSRGLTEDRLRLYFDDFAEIKVRIPENVSEQIKITEMLDTWDAAIAKLEELVEYKSKFYLGLSSLLKKLASENGKQIKFDDLFDIQIGGTPSRSNPEYWSSDSAPMGRPWVAISDLKEKHITKTSESITDLGIKNSNVKLIRAGSILMSFKLSIGKRAIAAMDCYTNEAIAALLIKDKNLLSESYLYHALNWVNFDAEIDPAIKGRTLNKDKVKRLELLVPNMKIQQRLTVGLEATDNSTEITKQVLNQLRLQRLGLMQQLLTGKKRVKV